MSYTLLAPASATYEIKRSKFIAHLVPYSDFDEKLKALKAAHPKARHFVSASRYFNASGQLIESFSDDAEPRGTAGRPTLSVLQGSDLVDVAAITVRYFGGIKLGTGGLVRAYSDALNLALAQASLTPYKKTQTLSFSIDYKDVRRIEHMLKQLGINDISKEFASSVHYRISAPKEEIDALLSAMDGLAHIPHRQEDTKR